MLTTSILSTLTGSETTVIEGRSDTDRYASTMHALTLIGVPVTLQDQLRSALAGILYLGQVSKDAGCCTWHKLTGVYVGGSFCVWCWCAGRLILLE